MINLLPPEIKEELLLEKKTKVFVILGITILVPLTCFILILSAITFDLWGENNSQSATLQSARQQYQTADFLQTKDAIQKDNKTLSQLSSFYQKETYASDVLHLLSGALLPNNLYLTDLSIDRNTGTGIKVTAAGFSDSRDTLLLFQKNLQANPTILHPSFSPDSWIEAEHPKFNVTFQIGA